MYIGSSKNQSQRKGLIVFSLLMAVLAIFSAVQMMAADAGKTTAVNANTPQETGAVFTDTVTVDNNTPLTVTEGVSVTGVVTTYTLYMPVIFKPLVISVNSPNSSNQWTVSWSDVPGATGYIVQQSQDPDFSTILQEVTVGAVDSYQLNNALSFKNIYYHRVKPIYAGGVEGQWSNTVMVIGGYRDDFSNPSSGWTPVRRTTYLEETVSYYGTGSEAGNLIIIVADRWDWLIASPLAPAPKPPYAIEFRTRVHDASNLVSGGVVFGGDWNGQACPEIGNVYETTNCFNHFYNFNFIFYGPLKLLHEQVNTLAWCPNCGGSPIKRLGPTIDVDPILSNGPSLEWHTYRIEVRSSGVKFFVDNNLRSTFSDTTFINEPYFGVFASTDEYKPSIWFFDYYQVKPLD